MRPPQVAHEDDRASVVEDLPDGWQGGPDARVVGDAAPFDGHIEINTDKGAPVVEVVIGEKRHDGRMFQKPKSTLH